MFKPKIPKIPPPAQMQSMQAPKDMVLGRGSKDRLRRRGMWSTVFTSPAGINSPPSVTGAGGGLTGG